MIKLVPTQMSGAKIKVIGVGGAGGNIINSMMDKGIDGVQFIAINTDAQALEMSQADVKIQIGKNITKGLGAGMKEDVGFKAVEESRDEIEKMLEGSDMVFITAGMGGGTGTGAAPAIAHIAKAMNTLVVAIVTKPFVFEGKPRMKLAESGVQKLSDEIDSLIVIPNERILDLVGKDTSEEDAFDLANRVLYNATNGISQIITKPGKINVDFADVRTIMKDKGEAMMGTGIATGEGRAAKAAAAALSNPLLDQIDIAGSECVLTNVSYSKISIHELNEINSIIQEAAGEDAAFITGMVKDDSMKDEIMVTVIATGFNRQQVTLNGNGSAKVVEIKPNYAPKITTMITDNELSNLDKPAWQRREIKLNDDMSEEKHVEEKYTDETIEEFKISDDFQKPAFLRRQMD